MDETYEGNEATAAMAVDADGSGGGTEEVGYVTDETTEGSTDGFFSTPAPELVMPKPHKHRGYIKSARTLLSAQKGTGGIEFIAQSETNGQEYKRTIWVLDAYRDNPNIDAEKELKGLPAPEGKVQTPYERYGKTIQNKKGSAELQTFINAGVAVGRNFTKYTTFDELGEVLAAGLIGTPIVFKDRAEETDTGFRIALGDVFPLTNAKGLDMFDVLKTEAANGG